MSTTTVPPTPAARPRLDRFLIAILIGIAALLLAAGVAAFMRQPAVELPADTPGGTVQRFYNALAGGKYQAAYQLLSDSMANKPTLDAFIEYNATNRDYAGDRQNSSARIEREEILDEVAYVTVRMIHYDVNSGPFGGSGTWSSTESFVLRKDNGVWRITQMPYSYMPYNYKPY